MISFNIINKNNVRQLTDWQTDFWLTENTRTRCALYTANPSLWLAENDVMPRENNIVYIPGYNEEPQHYYYHTQ